LQEVNVQIPVPSGTKSRFVICDIKKNHLKVGLKGQPPIVEVSLLTNVCSFMKCTLVSYLQFAQVVFSSKFLLSNTFRESSISPSRLMIVIGA
jgi:hypothetical protein